MKSAAMNKQNPKSMLRLPNLSHLHEPAYTCPQSIFDGREGIKVLRPIFKFRVCHRHVLRRLSGSE